MSVRLDQLALALQLKWEKKTEKKCSDTIKSSKAFPKDHQEIKFWRFVCFWILVLFFVHLVASLGENISFLCSGEILFSFSIIFCYQIDDKFMLPKKYVHLNMTYTTTPVGEPVWME